MNGFRLTEPRFVLFGLLLAGFVFVAAFAPWIAPHDPLEQSLFDQFLPVAWASGGSSDHILGTDSLGRDLLSQLIWGARPALLVMLAGGLSSALIGIVLGVLAGYLRGAVDLVISRILEIFMSFPPMLVAIALAAVIGPGLHTVIAAVVLIGWTRFCRVVRGEVIAMRELDFITMARTLGSRPMRIVTRDVLPNLLPILAVLLGLEMGHAVVVEAVLSFIGFSSSNISTWGGIIADGRSYINQAWWVVAEPVFVVIIVVLGINGFFDCIRQAIDPVLKR